MPKRIISALLALILCISLAVSVSAAENEFIVNELGYLTDEEVSSLNLLAAAIYEQTGVGIYFVYAQTDDVETFDVTTVVGDIPDYVVMLENETHWYMHLGGRGEIITLEDEDALRGVYDEPDTYIEGVSDFLEAAAVYFPALPAATEATESSTAERFLYDEADLLTDDEEKTLSAQLEEISHSYATQLVIYTMASMEGADIDTYVDYLYDSMGFGYGENHEGVLLLISMDPREYRILSNGYAGEAIGTDEIDKLCDTMIAFLPDGYYTTAFHMFADQCGEFLAYYQAGSPFLVGKNLIISLIIGLIAGLITAFVLKGQLKSVKKQYQANAYMKQNSLSVDIQHDIFLYSHISRTEKKKESTSSSSGSGGSTRSKGGGSF